MHLDQDFYVGSDSIAYSLDQFNCARLLCQIEFVEARTKRIEFQRSITFGNDALRCCMELLGSALDGVPAVGVGFDLVSYGTAQKFIDGLTKRFADDIPARHLDSSNRRHGNLASAGKIVAEHILYQGLDVHRIVTQDMIGHSLAQIALQGLGMVQHANLANALQSLVRQYLHNRDITPLSADHMNFYIGNFHIFALPTALTVFI